MKKQINIKSKNQFNTQKNPFQITRIALYILILAGALFFSGCDNNNYDDVTPAKTYVLVHGAWQASWVWDDVKSQLQKSGQQVITVELPAHGTDATSPAAVTLDGYAAKVIDAINATGGKVILVGHSMGGMVVSEVAEKIPSKIEKLVYIGAFLPANNQSLIDLAAQDSTSLLGPNLVPSADQLTLNIKNDQIVNIFYQDGSAATKTLVLNKFKVEPAIPFTNKAVLTAANFGKVNKYYIHTALDNAVGFNNQKRMVKAAGITQTYTLKSGHCPFLSMPQQVTNLLLKIGQ